jgi:hypothetical protein
MIVTRDSVLRELLGGLWHATHPNRFEMILRSAAILPEPNIPDNERLSTREGPKSYPYVRTIGGVSLFDFDGFDPEAYGQKYPMSSWFDFVPFRRDWQTSVWIEIDRQVVAPNIVSSQELAARQNAAGAHRHKRMPQIEVAHLGPVPRAAFKRAFLV